MVLPNYLLYSKYVGERWRKYETNKNKSGKNSQITYSSTNLKEAYIENRLIWKRI